MSVLTLTLTPFSAAIYTDPTLHCMHHLKGDNPYILAPLVATAQNIIITPTLDSSGSTGANLTPSHACSKTSNTAPDISTVRQLRALKDDMSPVGPKFSKSNMTAKKRRKYFSKTRNLMKHR